MPSGPPQAFVMGWHSSWNELPRTTVESKPPVEPASASAASPRMPVKELDWIVLPWALVILTPLLTLAKATWSIVIPVLPPLPPMPTPLVPEDVLTTFWILIRLLPATLPLIVT